MKVCYRAENVTAIDNYYSVKTNAVEIRLWYLTDDIIRIRAGFDGDWDEASYSLVKTAWESRTDELLKDYYASRSSNAQTADWSQKSLSYFSYNRRPEVKIFLQKQGFDV